MFNNWSINGQYYINSYNQGCYNEPNDHFYLKSLKKIIHMTQNKEC